MSITTALEARRDALREREAGFTLIELLVVVLIIGILAAIAIPVYLGVQNNAKDSAVKSDLANNKTAISAYATTVNNGVLPPDGSTQAELNTLLKNYGWGVTPGSTFTSFDTTGTGSAQAFCLIQVSATGTSFFTSTAQPITQGTTCGAVGTW